jgi:hypothetical protein
MNATMVRFTMMRKQLLLFLGCICLCTASLAQTYNNEWINYSNTYYKFKIGADGVYRISQSTLTAAGLGSADAATFQLWRNGEQVPLYTSVPSGELPATGFIEFYGRANDGKPDRAVYLKPTFQTATKWSLFTDSATYFLTINTAGGNKRVSDYANNISTNTLHAEPYFMCHNGQFFKNSLDNGVYESIDGGYIISSSYDAGEGWIDGNGYYPGQNFTYNFSGLPVYASGPASSARIGFGNLQFDNRIMEFGYNSPGYHVLKDSNILQTEGTVLSGSIPTNQLSSGSIGFTLTNENTTDGGDEYTVSFVELTFPSLFTFGNQSLFPFSLAASDTGKFLQISQFNYGSVAPVLYDLTNGLRITGDLSAPGYVQYVLPPSMTYRDLVMMSEDPSQIQHVTSLTAKTFVNFSNAANQGNYYIISNPILYNDGEGNNYVQQYQAYRNSSAGGGFNAKIIDMNELVDQFAFGIKMDPLSIRNFLKFARNTFSIKPQYCLLIGKGVNYMSIRAEENIPTLYKLALVPTWGNPASDMLLACDSNSFGLGNATPIGRVSAINGSEVAIYLQKVKEYEQVNSTYTGIIADEAWKKNVVHVVGALSSTGALIQADMVNYANVISDTAYGGVVTTFAETGTTSVQSLTGAQIDNLFNTGVGLVNYFGHSAANILGYNLGDPSQFNMRGKYPFFIANGCDAGDMFEPDSTRLVTPSGYSVTEDYILSPENGSIGFIGASSIGIVNYLDSYNTYLYNDWGIKYYGAPSGQQMMHVTHDLGNVPSFASDFYGRTCLEQLSLDGDPFISLYHVSKPDYAIETPQVVISPTIISVANSSFSVNAHYFNLGVAVNDSILVTIKWQLPNGSQITLYNQKRAGTFNEDSIQLNVPINPTVDKGNNTLIVDLNADGKISEMTMANNVVSIPFYIYDQDVSPIWPSNYSIVNKSPITFYCSSADPLDSLRNYVFEIDTTANFNSPQMVKQQTSSKGGVFTFNPTVSLRDSVVYYWRVAILPSTGVPTNWSLASFIYIPASTDGWNQSHYYQWQNNTFATEELDSDRVFRYAQSPHSLQVQTQIYPYGGDEADEISIDGQDLSSSNCGSTFGSLVFFLVNQSNNKLWVDSANAQGNGLYGSNMACTTFPYLFQFPVNTTAGRKLVMNFLDSIPAGTIVSIWNWMISPTDTTQMIGAWKSDTATFGSGNSLYNAIKGMGFTSIDSFYHMVPLLYVGEKQANGTFKVFSQQAGSSISQQLTATVGYNSTLQQGTMTTTTIGPAKAWQEIKWNGTWDSPADSLSMMVYGIKKDSSQTLLYASGAKFKDTALTFIPAATYPYLQVKVLSKDSVKQTPYQIQRLMVKYQDVPEGAIAPNHYFNCPDSLQIGQPLDFGVGFNNVSDANFDSLSVLLTITDNNNVAHTITVPKQKPLVAGDSLHVLDTINTTSLVGKNTLYVYVNPNMAQPEQYMGNNFLYKTFYVKGTNYQPTMDVTFDGIHILNQDIVSAKPQILIKLTDASPYVGLTDSSDVTVQVRFPDGSLRSYVMGSDSAQFIPANLSTGKNIATVILHPTFAEDGNYSLIATGQDQLGNTAGRLNYQVSFRVINTPMISNVFNYPNPFTTSTAFVFTITGSEIPQMLRIEIMTITGKIVREINEWELGPIHIGTNITTYKWNGTDQYGNKVGNGVYLYRVITNLNSKSLGHFTDQGDNTSQYFKSGYGKMYLMR